MNGQKMLHHRGSIRLQGYDYSEEGGYFITIVTHERASIFGNVIDGEMILNDFGKIVQEEWVKTKEIRQNVEILEDEYCVMPNHFHGIIWLIDNPGSRDLARNDEDLAQYGRDLAGYGRDLVRQIPTDQVRQYGKPVANSLITIIGAFKSSVTRRINLLRGMSDPLIWQKRFYDHIIRDEKDYQAIAEYIELNPAGWEKDVEFVDQ